MTANIKNQTFGFEMEFYGMTRLAATRAIQSVVGGRVEQSGYRSYKVVDGQGRGWKVVYDGSIRNTTGEQCEMVSPVLKYEDIETLQEIIRALRAAGAKVNDSCGIHIHVGADKHNARSLKNLVNIMYSKQDMLYRSLKMHDARANKWAKKIKPVLVDRFKSIKTEAGDARFAWYGDHGGHAQKYDESRYHGLNLHAVWQTGTVEFRLFNSTTHAGRAKAYIQFCLAVSALAINSKSSRATVTVSDNEKYTFRTWLLRLGLIGDEFKTCRTHMLANLEGNSAWRNAN